MTSIPRTGVVAERRAAYAHLRAEGVSIGHAAARLRVDRRTGDRYEAWLRSVRGVPSCRRPAWWMREPILTHLHRFPHTEFTATDMARVLGGAPSTALRALRAMARTGEVELIVGLRDEDSPNLVNRFRLAIQEEARAA